MPSYKVKRGPHLPPCTVPVNGAGRVRLKPEQKMEKEAPPLSGGVAVKKACGAALRGSHKSPILLPVYKSGEGNRRAIPLISLTKYAK